jgi:hypothetical protein
MIVWERWKKMAKYGEKMWEKLERYVKMKKLLERDTNGNDKLRDQNMVKMKSDAKIRKRWKEMPKYAIVSM